VKKNNWSAFVLISMALFVLFASNGCTRKLQRIDTSVPSPEIIKEVINSHYSIDRFESDFSITLKALIFGAGMFGNIKVQYPDRLSAELKGPMGVHFGSIVIKNGFYELQTSNGQIVKDYVENFNVEEMTGIPFPSNDLFVVFSPVPLPIENAIESKEFVIHETDSLWYWRFSEGELDHEIIFDPDKLVILSENWYDNKGDKLLGKKYQKNISLKGKSFAGRVIIDSKGKIPVHFSLTYDQPILNPKWKKDQFQFKTVDNHE